MPKKRPAPTTFDAYLGGVVEGLTGAAGGRPALMTLLGVSDKTVQRKIAGETPFTVSELERIAGLVRVPAESIARTALTQYGEGDQDAGLAKLMSEAKGKPADSDDKIPSEEELREKYDLAAQEQSDETDPGRDEDPGTHTA